MKKLVNEYLYSRGPESSGNLKAVHERRCYSTKMKPGDLPEWYCDVHRYWWNHNMINTKGVVDLKYKWVKENHFMKDSVLRISYTGKIETYRPKYMIGGREVESVFDEYTNVGAMVFSSGIFKCLAYIRKYSNYDMSEIRREFVRQCEWLKENEPAEIHLLGDADFGEWFDTKVSDITQYNKQ